MQRQKTIAKWLAIILLLTSIIACYIAFSSIIKDKNSLPPDIAGADTDNSGNTGNPDDNPQPKPVYSAFPRAAEDVNGMSVSHVGGEDNDRLLGTVYYLKKRYVFFYSASEQYDVKECGIHIAVFENKTLLTTVKIAGAEETFITAGIAENGLLVITKNAAQTKLRLLDGSLAVTCENSFPLYSDYKLYITSASARLYTADERYIYSYTISNSLDVKRSNFVYPIENGKIVYTAALGAYDTLFVQSAQGAGLLTFAAADGFDYCGELANCRLLQILPNSVNGKPMFTLLSKCNDGIIATNVDGNLKKFAEYTLKGAKTAVAMAGENSNICIITDNSKYVFCSHLELQNSSAINADGLGENLEYKAIDGEKQYFIASQGDAHHIVAVDENTLTSKLKLIGKSATVVRENIDGSSNLSVLFDGNINNSFANMCFGGSDVFYITDFIK